MALVCRQCSRKNPNDAAFCYFDGVLLVGQGAGPLNAGATPFPHAFHFSADLVCRTFDQLAMACQSHWISALDLLKQGILGAFFRGLGRQDLAAAAEEAARYPDPDRGLDQLLGKLPSQVLTPAALTVEPTTLGLGQLAVGSERSFDLHLQNLGMRLVHGSVRSDCPWLLIGDAASHKSFQFLAETIIPVRVAGKHLRAGAKRLEGHLIVESNAGYAKIAVRADVPVSAFDEGTLAGALSPRQVAEKARADPAAAVSLFENGAVARWFTRNGWTYPVEGPGASGLGAVQQFFEALGLAKAPLVEIKTTAILLQGEPGQSLQTTVEVSSPEKKPVYAHAVCEQLWVDCSKVRLAGRSAIITVTVPSVPDRAGETLNARVTVKGNGNQTFAIPLTLEISKPNPFGLIDSSVAPAIAETSRPLTKTEMILSSDALPRRPLWMHFVPLFLLMLILIGILIRDVLHLVGR